MQLDSRVAPIYWPEPDQSTVLRLGLHRLERRDWLQPDADYPHFLQHKLRLGETHRDRVTRSLPGSEAAQREFHALLIAQLQSHHSEYLSLHPPEATGFRDIWHSCLLVQEDFCLLQRRDGDWVLTAASLCSPSNWKLEEKIGRSVTALHGPVPGYGEQLAARVERLLDGLKPGKPLLRFNWSLQPGNELCWRDDMPGPGPAADWYWRVERQTLLRLPQSEGVLFGIRIYLHSLDRLQSCAGETGRDYREVLAQLLRRLPAAERRFKNLDRAVAALNEASGGQNRD